MARIISPDGVVKDLDVPEGSLLGLERLQSLVGGLIEVVNLDHTEFDTMVINEEGKLIDLPPNIKASRIAGFIDSDLPDLTIRLGFYLGAIPNGVHDIIMGNAVLCNTTDEGEMVA